MFERTTAGSHMLLQRGSQLRSLVKCIFSYADSGLACHTEICHRQILLLYLLKFLAIELLSCVHAVLIVERFDAELPCLHVKRVYLFRRDVGWDHDIQGLALIDVELARSGLLQDGRLVYLGKRLEDSLFELAQEVEVLDRAVVIAN